MEINSNSNIGDLSNKNSNEHGGNIYRAAKELKLDINQILDASASLVPFPLPRQLENNILKAVTNSTIRNYPERSHIELRKAISDLHQIYPGMVLPGNGAAELITWSARDAASMGVSGLPTPGFGDYERAIRCWQGRYLYLPLPLSWSAKAPQTFPLEQKTDVLWITNPHNPTGQLWSRSSIEPLLKTYSLIICDEAFLPLVPNGEKQSLIPLTFKYENLIILRSFTKLFAIAGLRLGYAISREKRLKKWQGWRDPWPLNSIAIAAGLQITEDKKFIEEWKVKIHKWVNKEGIWLHERLKTIPGITSYPSSVNFQLIKSRNSLIALKDNLAKQQILVRDCKSFKYLGEEWIRISLQERTGNKKICKAIKDFLI